MYVIHDPDGMIRYTMIREAPPDGPDWIEVPDQDLGALDDWRVDPAGSLIRIGQTGMRATMTLSRRQLLIGMVSERLISRAEAMAPPHTPPAAIEVMFSRLPEPQQTAARITWATFSEARRLDPLVPMIAKVAPVAMDDAAIDQFFTTYATL